MKPLWTLRELVNIATQVLRKSGKYHGWSKRIKWEPNRRLAQYYASIGLLDKPADFSGRTGLYGMHHLLQLVAIKKLQVEGMSLKAIQEQLTGQSNTVLHQIADLPADWTPPRPKRIDRSDIKQMSLFDEAPTCEPAVTGFNPIPGVTLLIDRNILKTIDESQLHQALEALKHCLSR